MDKERREEDMVLGTERQKEITDTYNNDTQGRKESKEEMGELKWGLGGRIALSNGVDGVWGGIR